MKKTITKIFKSIMFYTIIYILLFVLGGFILNKFGYAYLKWFIYMNMFISLVGIIAGTIQLIIKTKQKGKRLLLAIGTITIEIVIILSIDLGYIFLQDQEQIVYKDNKKMIKETHSFLVSNWINYYNYENIFVRKKQVRICEAHNNYIGDLINTTYYDEHGNVLAVEKNNLLEEQNKTEEIVEWNEINESGINEDLLLENIYINLLQEIARNLQGAIEEEVNEERDNPELVLTEGWTRIFNKEGYKNVINIGKPAIKPLYYILYKSPNNGLYEYLCATALQEISGIGYKNGDSTYEWRNAKEYLDLFTKKVISQE